MEKIGINVPYILGSLSVILIMLAVLVLVIALGVRIGIAWARGKS